MTTSEFPGPGLTGEQWDLIAALATSLTPGQALWVSGYFAGLDRSALSLRGGAQAASSLANLAPAPARPNSDRSLTILFGSETGNSSQLARLLAEAAGQTGRNPVLVDMADYKVRRLKDEQDLLVVTSTHGEGDPPLSAKAFFEFVESHKAPRLANIRFAVLALGDSTYERYCEAGKRIDRRLAELGAERLSECVECDVDYDEAAASWIKDVVAKSAPVNTIGGPVSIAVSGSNNRETIAFDKRRPFAASVIENIVLTGRGSTKETRHLELSLADSGIRFQPGDAIGVVPRNDPAIVEALLALTSLSAGAEVEVKGEATTLGEALSAAFEITASTPRFLDQWASISDATALKNLQGDSLSEERSAFLREHHVIDIVRRFPVRGLDPKALLAGLRPLQPRLYSIASSASFAADEAHLTVSTVRYPLHGEVRSGVASGHMATRAEIGATLPVYVQPNPHFRLPDDGVPIIMIGAGTGVAPYRAFLQEREARGASGRSWLIFGERNFRSDFLYQTEWQGWLKDGTLSRMSVAFSRDSAEKTYVQHRLRQHARDVYAWLEEGAHIYVCGDGAHLAPDVHSVLGAIVQQEGRRSREAASEYLGALQQQHRYQIDVY
jgi:sulfite reductase (NADPH) flavoprotein alpha-component